MYNISSIREIK